MRPLEEEDVKYTNKESISDRKLLTIDEGWVAISRLREVVEGLKEGIKFNMEKDCEVCGKCNVCLTRSGVIFVINKAFGKVLEKE